MKPKRMTSYRLSDKARTFLDAIADEEDLSMTAMLEILIKEEAKKRKMNYEVLAQKYGGGDS